MALFPFVTKDGATRVPPRRWNPGRTGYSQGAAHGKGPEMKGTSRPQRVDRGLPAPQPPLLLRGVSSESPTAAGGRGRHEREPGFLGTVFGTTETASPSFHLLCPLEPPPPPVPPHRPSPGPRFPGWSPSAEGPFLSSKVHGVSSRNPERCRPGSRSPSAPDAKPQGPGWDSPRKDVCP